MRNEFSDEIIKVDKFGREFLSTTICGGGGGGDIVISAIPAE